MTEQAFELLRSEEIQEINGAAFLWRHRETGTELVAIENDDNNKAFMAAFATVPADSTGVPHILEHSVLAGSQNYPVKDPFMQLVKGSVNTYLNAFTSADRTCYPVASTNHKDFLNLIRVYLDAVFHPLLREEIFLQEGRRFEVQPDGSLALNGIVFNEMKGALSEPTQLLGYRLEAEMLPDTPYCHNFGGDPKKIPDLSYEAFCEFYRVHYHPTNSKLMLWGNFDREQVFAVIDEAIRSAGCAPQAISLPLQPRFKEPKSIVAHYAVASAGTEAAKDNKNFVVVGWLLGELKDPVEELALSILDHLLLMTPASPLKRALIESGLGEGLAAWGLDDSCREAYFSTGLRGVAAAHQEKVVELILSTIAALEESGLAPEDLAASLNEVEFDLREKNSGSHPQGLAITDGMMRKWLRGGDPFAELKFEEALATLKERLATEPRLLEGLLRKYLIDNPHRVTVFLRPDPEKAQRDAAEERLYLQNERARLSDEQLAELRQKTAALQQFQQTPDSPADLAKIPGLRLGELQREIDRIPTEMVDVAGCRMLQHDLFTNGIIYLNLALDLSAVPQRLLPYLSLFARSLREMGTIDQDFIAFNRRIGSQVGGFSVGNLVQPVLGSEQPAARLVLYGKALPAQVEDLTAIMGDALLKVSFADSKRFKEMALELKSGLERQIIGSGSAFVMTRLGAKLSPSGCCNEVLGGVEQLFFLRRLLERCAADWAAVRRDLEELQAVIGNSARALWSLTAAQGDFPRVNAAVAELLARMPQVETAAAEWLFSPDGSDELLTVSAESSFAGQGQRLPLPGASFPGSATVVMRFISRDYLMERVRLQGGAYSVHGGLNPYTGVLAFCSYRDGNPGGTLKVFGAIGEHLQEINLPPEEIERYQIGTIGDADSHLLPDGKGRLALTRYLCGIPDQWRQQFRHEIFDTTLDDFRNWGARLKDFSVQGRVVLLGSSDIGERVSLAAGRSWQSIALL